MSLQNKTILVTGASKGIGKALALLLADKGANLSLVARSEAELVTLKSEIEAKGAKAEIFVGSVGDEDFVKACISATIEIFGKIDALVNNAGFGIFKQASDISTQEWDSIYETNVKGTFLFCREAIPFMKSAGEGHIINIASDVAKRVFDGGSLYCSSKYAQDAFSMALRKEVRKDGIKVSVIYSGLVDTYFHTREEGDPYQAKYLTSQNMADTITYILEAPKHVVIDELMIHPMSQDY